jgi:glycosyltransferase involved in cell wall biosynthesis
MKINILDPGLSPRSGHHYDFDRKLGRHLAAAGHEVHLYGFDHIDDAVVEEFRAFGKITKLFRSYPYQDPRSGDRYSGELEMILDSGQELARDLAAVQDADLWIWPSMRVQHLNACVLRGVAAPIVGCIHEDPGIEAKAIGALLWRAAFLSASRRKLRYSMGSIEGELRHRFMPIMPDGRFAVFPQPFEGPPIDAPKPALRRIGFFGNQRGEKGAALIEPLMQRLTQDGYTVVFQSSGGRYPGVAPPEVEMLDFVEDIAVPIRTCDLVVLPYDVEQYRGKGSGILAQCMALGIPVTAPVGTLPGRLIEQSQIGPLFSASRLEAIHQAIKYADRNYEAFANNALAFARHFVKRNGVGRFADAFLSCAGLAGP